MSKVPLAPHRTYLYSPINETEIRLLKLKATGDWAGDPKSRAGEADLEGELLKFQVEFEHDEDNRAHSIEPERAAPHYDALSYHWGNGAPQTSLKLRERRGNDTFDLYLPITPNLESALRCFRQKIQASRHQRLSSATIQDPVDNNSVYLWIDAVCINQEDTVEHSAQLRKIADIYAQAESVRIWLGEDIEDSSRAVKFIEELSLLDQLDTLSTDPDSAADWTALRNILQHPWFKRRWIIQEIAYAKEARIYCGPDEIDWNDLTSAITVFAAKKHELRSLFHKSHMAEHDPDFLGEIEGYGAVVLVEILDIVLRKSDGDIVGHDLSLETLVSILTTFEATVAQDHIFAILYLCKDAKPGAKDTSYYEYLRSSINEGKHAVGNHHANTRERITHEEIYASPKPTTPEHDLEKEDRRGRSDHRLKVPSDHSRTTRSRSRPPVAARLHAEQKYNIQPRKVFFTDYQMSMYALCKEFVEFAASRSQSIDLICRAWVPDFKKRKGDTPEEDQLAMPSWLSPLSRQSYNVRPMTRVYDRVAADSLVGTAMNSLRNYSASGSIGAAYLDHQQLIRGRKLMARGFVVDAIGETCQQALNAVMPADWLKVAEVTPSLRDGISFERFWRTLVANRASCKGPQRPPSHWQWACDWVLRRRNQHESGHLDINQLLMKVSGTLPSVVVDFLQRVKAVVWNRQLFQTQGRAWNAMLGLAPAVAAKGDLICILHGCSVPVILRKQIAGVKRKQAEECSSNSRGPKRRFSRTTRGATIQRPEQTPFDEAVAGMGSGVQSAAPTAESADMVSEIDAMPSTAADPRAGTSHLLPDMAQEAQAEYVLIGECYVHGLMDGEAFRIQECSLTSGEMIPDVDFCIV